MTAVDLRQAVGFDINPDAERSQLERKRIVRYINLQLMAMGLPTALQPEDREFSEFAKGLLDRFRQQSQLLRDHRAPIDARIETFLQNHFSDVAKADALRLPNRSFILDRHGIARELSLPVDGDHISSDLVESYRVKNGVLHNPRHDRRTTKGTFHVCEGGLPIAGDKKAVPKKTFVALFQAAMKPPAKLNELPFTSNLDTPAQSFVSLLLRPMVCPEVPGVCPQKTMETRFYVPGSLVSNLDFVESIFGNAGDASLPENDAALDIEHWTGHTGAVILAPQMLSLTKKEVHLPHWEEATEQQRKDGMCWTDESEIYNDGTPFKLTCRTDEGVVVTLIADNYFGYCKKEVKTQLSYSANLYGNAEEEHAGGALAFSSYSLGDNYQVISRKFNGRTFADITRDYAPIMEVKPEGYAVDKLFNNLIYIPEDANASLIEQKIRWTHEGKESSIPLLPGKVYMAPSGYKLRMEKHPEAPSWRLIGTTGEGVFCHKPCTVSGGGKSEISKSLNDYMLFGSIFVADLDDDLDRIQEMIDYDYQYRWREDSKRRPDYSKRSSRALLDPKRSLGSVVKLLTPSPDYTDEYNDWLEAKPNYLYAILFIIKRFYRPDWGETWRERFTVDLVNGFPGHELKYHDRKIVGFYLRVGLHGAQSSWRTFKLRQDFCPAAKVQTEDDISASVVVPKKQIPYVDHDRMTLSCKFTKNCEYRLFQRPDDAIHRGLDKQTEWDLAQPGNFISNFEPLTHAEIAQMMEYVADFESFSEPMQKMLKEMYESEDTYVVCSANPRKMADGQPTKNPRYLQVRPDLVKPLDKYVAEQGIRFSRAIPIDEAVHQPVDSVLVGRRNNPPDYDQGIRPLAVYNPIHYQELPELFMDFICSLTGKSPSTTGAGSEGALTKGPFNALRFAPDLNTALISYALTGLHGFSTAAGHIGPNVRVDHDVSLLIPEVWCRLTARERDPEYLIEQRLLAPLEDFTHKGERIFASRLGYRITRRFVQRFFGRIFDNPDKVFDQSILEPETQDFEAWVDGIKYITEAHQRVARQYFADGTVEDLCPPLKAIVHIMAEGTYEGKNAQDPAIRQMFQRDAIYKSDWYAGRLKIKQQRDIALWKKHLANLQSAQSNPVYQHYRLLNIDEKKQYAEAELARVQDPSYLDSLRGTLGASKL
ncbi:HPt domain-containing protein [Planctomycetales bacterium 10988]|nr:HPt domain-containing protein [Planctomycetales bacterium 10988]